MRFSITRLTPLFKLQRSIWRNCLWKEASVSCSKLCLTWLHVHFHVLWHRARHSTLAGALPFWLIRCVGTIVLVETNRYREQGIGAITSSVFEKFETFFLRHEIRWPTYFNNRSTFSSKSVSGLLYERRKVLATSHAVFFLCLDDTIRYSGNLHVFGTLRIQREDKLKRLLPFQGSSVIR